MAELFSAAPCCVTGFVYDWAWILHGCWHFKNPCYGRTVKLGWAQTQQTDLLFHPSAAGPRLTRQAFKKVAPIAISLFIKTECFTSLRSLELFLCRWMRLVIGLAWNPSVKGGQIHYLGLTQRHFVWLHLRANLLGSPTACSHAYKLTALRVFVDETQRCLFVCKTKKLVFMEVKQTRVCGLWVPMKTDT